MWVVIIYPPALVPNQIGRPAKCQRCDASGSMVIHERVIKPVPYVNSSYEYSAGLKLVSSYGAARFRCRECGSTVTPLLPDALPGSRVSQAVATQIVVRYCMGKQIEDICNGLQANGQEVGYTTAFGIIRGLNSAELRALHRTNRRRQRRIERRFERSAVARRGWLGFSWEIPDETGMAKNTNTVRELSDPQETSYVDILRVVEFLPLNRTQTIEKTLTWICTYLERVGGGCVLEFPSFDRMFECCNPYSDDLYQVQTYVRSSSSTADGFYGPVDRSSVGVQRAMNLALRGLLSSGKLEHYKTRVQSRRGLPAEMTTTMALEDDIYDVLDDRPENGLPL